MKFSLLSCRAGWLCSALLVSNPTGFCPTLTAAVQAPLRVLFLGDNGHHKPADRFKQLEPVLAARRIELDYSDSLEDLAPAKLVGYDCLLVYANWTQIA